MRSPPALELAPTTEPPSKKIDRLAEDDELSRPTRVPDERDDVA